MRKEKRRKKTLSYCSRSPSQVYKHIKEFRVHNVVSHWATTNWTKYFFQSVQYIRHMNHFQYRTILNNLNWKLLLRTLVKNFCFKLREYWQCQIVIEYHSRSLALIVCDGRPNYKAFQHVSIMVTVFCLTDVGFKKKKFSKKLIKSHLSHTRVIYEIFFLLTQNQYFLKITKLEYLSRTSAAGLRKLHQFKWIM